MVKAINIERVMMHGDIFSFPGKHNINMPIHIDLLGIDYCHETFYIKRELSDITVIGYIVSGHGIINIENKSFIPSEGDLFILPEGTSHEYYVDGDEPWVFKWFNIRGPLVPALLDIYGLKRLYTFSQCNVASLFDKALEISAMSDIDIFLQHKQISLIVFEILTEVADNVQNFKNAYSDTVKKIKCFLDNNIENSISLEAISCHVSMSQRNINRVFKKEVGLTVYDYLLNQKIKLAKTLLLNTNLSIKEISTKLSFSDVYYFSNLFKRKAGVSPSVYRKSEPIN